MPVVKILLESGAINAAYLLIYNVTLLSGSQSLEIMASVVCLDENFLTAR